MVCPIGMREVLPIQSVVTCISIGYAIFSFNSFKLCILPMWAYKWRNWNSILSGPYANLCKQGPPAHRALHKASNNAMDNCFCLSLVQLYIVLYGGSESEITFILPFISLQWLAMPFTSIISDGATYEVHTKLNCHKLIDGNYGGANTSDLKRTILYYNRVGYKVWYCLKIVILSRLVRVVLNLFRTFCFPVLIIIFKPINMSSSKRH